MPLRDYLSPLRLPVRGRGDKYEHNWQALERTINAQTPLCYGAAATVNAGTALTAGVQYYASWSIPSTPMQDRWQIIDPVLLGGVTTETDPPVVRIPWDGLWDLRVTWLLQPVAQTGYLLGLDTAPYYDDGVLATFTNLTNDSCSIFPASSLNIIYWSIFLGVPLRANQLIRFGIKASNNTSSAIVVDQMFRWMSPYPNGEVMGLGQIPVGGND